MDPSSRAAWATKQFFEKCYRIEAPKLERPRAVREVRSTLNVYADFFRFHLADLGLGLRPPTLADFSDELLAEFKLWCVDTGRTRATANKHLRTLLAIWRLAWQKRILADAPRLGQYRVSPAKRSTWNEAEYQRIVTAGAAMPGSVGGVPARVFWPGLLTTLAATGARINALMLTTAGGFCATRGTLKVEAAYQKHGSDQVFALPANVIQLLKRIGAVNGSRLFGCWPHDPGDGWKTLTRHYRRVIVRAGLRAKPDDVTPKELFHAIRAAVATWIARELGEEKAREYLGHSSVTVTRVYLDLSQMPHVRDCLSVLPVFDVPQQLRLVD